MAHMTPEEEGALTEAMQLLEAQPVESTTSQTSANTFVSVTNDDNIPAQREKLAVLVSTGRSKKPSVCSSHMIRLNAFPTRMYKNTPKGIQPTSATRPQSL